MNDQNKSKLKEESPKNVMGGTAVKPSAWRKLLSKKWAAPAAFMAAAAIIVTLMWLYQGDKTATTTTNTDLEVSQGTTEQPVDQMPTDDSSEVASSNETMQWPADRTKLEVVAPFYDAKATSEERQAAMIQTGNTFTANTGIDLAEADNKTFDVSAALSGKVTVAEQHPLNGNVVEIKHADGIVTVYQSLGDLQVKVGDEVKQGTVIGKAGRSELEKDLGIHLHFEVRKDGKPVNPNLLLATESADATN
jgi:stage II sporulation protein Q